jgi:cyclopropane fatty-acyl-phospholipid synthase-like methyltransferase
MFKNFIKYVGNNFGNPRGIGGKISTLIMNIINQKQYDALLKNINLKPNNTILDIGFGNGYLINKLFEQNVPVTVYGIEISNDMLHKVECKQKKNIENGRLKLFLEDIGQASFERDTFDKIYTINTIYFWADLEKCFSIIKKILKPNGIFINIIYTKKFMDKIIYTKYGFNKYTVDEIENMTKNYGMEIRHTIEIKQNKSYCIIAENKK